MVVNVSRDTWVHADVRVVAFGVFAPAVAEGRPCLGRVTPCC